MKIKFTHKTIAAVLLLGGMLVATPSLAQHRQPRSGGSSSQQRSSAPRERVERPSAPSSSSQSRRDISTSSPGRDRSTVTRNQSSGTSTRPSSSSVSRPSTRSDRPSVSRPQTNERPSVNRSTSTTRSENRSFNDNNRGNRPGSGNDLGNRPSRGGSGNHDGGIINRPSRGGSDGGNVTRPSRGGNDGGIINRPNRGGNDRGGNDRDGYGKRPGRGGSGSGNFDNHGNNFRNDKGGGKDRPGGFNARPDNRPRHERPGGGDPNRFSRYNQYRYHDGFRPHGPHHDRFYDHYRYGWNRPIMPPVRPYRHTIWYYRPTIPYGFRPYRNAPIVDGILGLFFGTLYDASLDYLYYNGFAIDGYYDNIVYLRDVPLFDYEWPDVMLRYDDYNQLNYAQFAIVHSYNDRARYNRLYRRLCASYGNPVSYVRGAYPQVTWVGGDGRGYITLSLNHDAGRYYTALSFGY